jgi:ubiquinone/menaquinone biosynthesis C-methylase UbiE
MDQKTVKIYDNQSASIAKRHNQMIPTRLYSLVETFFKKNVQTLDLGCGAGRDTHWLNINHFPTLGMDASIGMLNIARENYPQYTFKEASLPQLGCEENSFTNIFLSAVLMHIPRPQLVTSIMEILKITKPNGRIIISYRNGAGETDGRLFETYHPGQIAQLFESLGGKVLLIEKDDQWNNLVIEKGDLQKRDGIQKIQEIISRDKKTSTYKFALLRALCEISRYEQHVVTWYRDGDMALVPLKRIAVRWVHYYWPLIKEDVRQTTNERMSFEDELKNLHFKKNEFVLLKNELDSLSKEIQSLLKKVSKTIQQNPVKYSGGGNYSIFKYMSGLDASVYQDLKDSEFGMIGVPLSFWRDINYFSSWIEDSLCIQWAELSEKINKDGNFANHLNLITKSVQEDERSTSLVRKLFENKPAQCVWTGKIIEKFAVDHMIPWSIWRNNDLWNLLPAHPKVNNQKRDAIPSIKIIKKQFDLIKKCWEIYLEEYPNLFEPQIMRGLGLSIDEAFHKPGLEALEQTVIRLNINRGGQFWGG